MKKDLQAQAKVIEAACRASGLEHDEFARRLAIRPESLRKARKGYQAASDQLMAAIEQVSLSAQAEARSNIGSHTPLGHLQHAMAKAGIDAPTLAKKIGYRIGVTQAVVEGRSRASEKMLEAICEVLPTLSKERLMTNEEHPQILQEDGAEATYGAKPRVRLAPGMKGRYVPLLSFAQAGQYQIGHTDEAYGDEAVLALDIDDNDAFAVTIEGDSMAPGINPHDRVIVCPNWAVQTGDTVLVKTKEGDVFCKLYQRGTSTTLHLASVNPLHPPMTLRRSDVAWIYPVAQHTRNLRRK